MIALGPILLNFIYVFIGGLLTLFFMWAGARLMSANMPFMLAEELKKGNVAVGLAMGGGFIGIGVGLGLVVGMALN